MPETLVVPKFKSTITFGRTPTEAIVFGRLSYVKTKGGKHNLFDQRDRTDASGNIIGQDGGWGASLLITPGTDYTAWTAAALAVMESVHGSDRSKWPSKFTYRRPRGEEKDNIIRPIDLAKNPGYDGWEVMPFATYGEPPTIVGPNLERVMNRDEVYSGRWAYVAVNLYWMKGGPNRAKGLSAGLQSVQLMHHDDRIGAGAAAPEAYFQRQAIEPAGGASLPASGAVWGDEGTVPAGAANGNPFD
jgi:hypothetical protein